MKLKRLLPICLLAGSLLLTSCEDLLSAFMGGANRRSNSNQQNSEDYGTGYQGKQGATELNEEEWNRAFSLEEFAFRRSCHFEMVESSTLISIDVDNGKFKIDLNYALSSYRNPSYYFSFEKSARPGYINGTAYAPSGEDGSKYQTSSGEERLDVLMAQFGVVTYDYKDFHYDSKNKQYTSDAFLITIGEGQQATTLSCLSGVITIEDGFPKSVDFDYINSNGDESKSHYNAIYSKYNQTVVTLPDLNGNNNNNNGGNTLPTPEGEQISYNELYQAYLKRPEATYNHATYRVTSEGTSLGKVTYTGAVTLNYGMWESENDDSTLDLDFDSFMIGDEMIAELAEVPEAEVSEIEYYFNANNEEYIVHAYYVAMGIEISANIYIDKYFYVNAEFIAMEETYTAVELEWSTVDVSNKVMNVDGRTFVGSDVIEKDFIYYNASKEVTQGMTVNFNNGYCEMILTKAASGNVVSEIKQVMVGPYEQNGNVITVSFTYYAGEDDVYQEIPTTVVHTFNIVEDKIIMPTQNMDENNQPVDINLILTFSSRFSGYIYYPGNPTPIEGESIGGYYRFDRFEYTLEDENDMTAKKAAEDFVAQFNSNNLYALTLININEESKVFTFTDGQTAFAGTYTYSNGLITVHFLVKMDVNNSSQYETMDSYDDYDYSNGEISYVIEAGEGYSVRVIYKQFEM